MTHNIQSGGAKAAYAEAPVTDVDLQKMTAVFHK